jgi:hypothetical protein
MNKLAVFVEGYTEVLFVDKLIEEIAGKANVTIEHKSISGGSRARRKIETIKAARRNGNERYYVLIVNCGGDRQVKSRIIEEHQNLTERRFSSIVGLRDVRPDFAHADIPKLERSLQMHIKTKLIPVRFILAVLEIEAWFLAEATHFERIDPAITVAVIKSTLGFDPQNEDMQQRLAPADDLDKCYAIGSKRYEKRESATTVEALDFGLIYCDLRDRIPYLGQLIGHVEQFLAQPSPHVDD